MDVKKANVNLLLGKIRTYLNAQPAAMKKEKRFVEAEKALAKLEKVATGKVGELKFIACMKSNPIIPGF